MGRSFLSDTALWGRIFTILNLDFREHLLDEVRRIPIPRTPVNKVKVKGRDLRAPPLRYGFRALPYSKLAHREEPPVLLCEGVARNILCPCGDYRLVGNPTL